MLYNLVDIEANNYQLIEGNYFNNFDAGQLFIDILNKEFPFLDFKTTLVSERIGRSNRKEKLLNLYLDSSIDNKCKVYCFQTEGGGRYPDEHRIQWQPHIKWKPNLSSLQPAKEFTEEYNKAEGDLLGKECYIFSFYKRTETDDDIIISAVYSTLSGSIESSAYSSKSIQFKIQDIQKAFIDGIAVTEKQRDNELIIHFKPKYLLWYMLNRDKLHTSTLEECLEIVHDYQSNPNKYSSKVSPLEPPTNKIYYGAPGTGKSHQIKELLKDVPEEQQERITFHPEYDNASFVGGYMPITEGEDIKYKFVPQVFTNIYVKAWQNLDKPYYLVIEEINRGNCAEIFGEMFQLLDRTGGYSITPSQSLGEYLKKELGENHNGIKNGKMTLPNNLQLLATMNTSDQSLFPMDSAFKRRWTWKFVPINEEKNIEKNPSAAFFVRLDERQVFNWLDFILAVNQQIRSNPNLGADKCIGNYFIKPEDKEISLEEFINKAIFYLWVDVFQEETEKPFEDKDTFESFFPETTNGKQKVELMLKKLKKITGMSFFDTE